MSHPTETTSLLYALLIGIDCYLPHQLPDKGFSPSLGGCVRGISSIDTTPRPLESLVASREELLAAWQNLAGSKTRAVLAGSLWIPESQHYVLLAACRPHELANEFAFDGQAAHDPALASPTLLDQRAIQGAKLQSNTQRAARAAAPAS